MMMIIIIIIMSSCSFKTPSTTPTTNHFTESEAHSSLTQAIDWSEFHHSSPATQLLSKNFTDARKLPIIPTRMPSSNADWEAESPASGLRINISQKTKVPPRRSCWAGPSWSRQECPQLAATTSKPSTVCRLSRWNSGRLLERTVPPWWICLAPSAFGGCFPSSISSGDSEKERQKRGVYNKK